MSMLTRLWRTTRGTAAAEMALVTPLLLILMMGSVELGNYFYNEHILVKAVRDGARYAARQNFTNYDACSGLPTGTVVDDTKKLVKTGLLIGPSGEVVTMTPGPLDRLAAWNATTISVTMSCTTTANSTTLSGIYRGRTTGAPVVTVSAIVPYIPVLASFGFRGTGLSLNATQQAAVMGI